MADRLRLVVRGTYGQSPVTHLNFSDGTYVNPVRDTFQFTAPEHAPITAQPQGRWGGQRTVTETHNNATVAVRLLVRDTTSAEAALARVAELIEHADHYSRYGTRTMIEWRPDGATKSTYFELRGSPTWEPSYRWITFQSAGHSVELGLTFPVAPLAEGGEMDIYDDFSPRGEPLYTSLVTNPSMEVDASGWAAQVTAGITSSVVRSTAWAAEGVASLRHQVTANTGGAKIVDSEWVASGTQGISVVPGETWTITAVANVTINSSTGVYARFNWVNNAGTSIGLVTGTTATGTGVKTVTVTGVAPAGAAFLRPRIGITTVGTELVDFSIDKVTAVKSATSPGPFTGSSDGAAWSGLENASSSCLYSESSRDDYRQDAGLTTDFAVANGELRPVTTNAIQLTQTQRGYPVNDAQGTIEFVAGSAVTNINHAVRLMVKGPTTYLSCQYSGGSAIQIAKVEGGVVTTLTSAVPITTLVAGQKYWLRARIEGNTVTAEHYIAEANTPNNTIATAASYTLTAAEQAVFGREVAGLGGFTFDPDNASNLTDRLTQFRFEPYTYRNRNLPEEFDLLDVPGDAPAAVDVIVEKGASGAMSYFGMFGWGPKPAPENFVYNGDFESNVSTGWVNGPGSPAVAGTTGMTLVPTGVGRYGSASLGATSAGVAADEAVSFKMYRRFRAGRTYTAEVWYRNGGGTPTTPRIALGASTTDRSFVSAPAVASTTAWQLATVTWTPTADRDSAGVVVTSGTGAVVTQVLIDGVQVYEGTQRPSTTTQTEGRGGQSLFGVIEAESAYAPTWAITADGNARGGNVLQGTMAAGTTSHGWWVDPSAAVSDEFIEDVTIEFWARGAFASTAVSPTAVLYAFSEVIWIPSTALALYTNEYGTSGKPIPFTGSNPFLTRLGSITFPSDQIGGSRYLLRLDLTFGAGTSGTGKLDYIVAVPANRRFSSASGKSSALTSYNPFFVGAGVSGNAERKRVTTNLVGRSSLSNIKREQPSAGVGGSLIEPYPGDVRFVGLLSGDSVPDDPAGVSDANPANKTIQITHFAVTPRYRFIRSS